MQARIAPGAEAALMAAEWLTAGQAVAHVFENVALARWEDAGGAALRAGHVPPGCAGGDGSTRRAAYRGVIVMPPLVPSRRRRGPPPFKRPSRCRRVDSVFSMFRLPVS